MLACSLKLNKEHPVETGCVYPNFEKLITRLPTPLFVFIPLQDLVFYWSDDVTEEIYQNLLSKMREALMNNPQSRRISDYVFEFIDNKFVNAGKAIDLRQ